MPRRAAGTAHQHDVPVAAHLTRAAAPPDEAAVIAADRAEGLVDARAYDDTPGARYAAHVHDFDKVLHCVAGGVVFTTADGQLRLTPGDRLDLERGTEHSAVIGPDGVRLVEAHRTG